MRIGIVGVMYYIISLNPDRELDRFGSCSGYAETYYSSKSVELAKKLATDHEVTFFTSLDTPVPQRILKLHKINTKYITYENRPVGTIVKFGGTEEGHVIGSGASNSNVLETLKLNEKAIFNNLDVMIMDDFYPEIIKLCKKHKLKMYIQLEKDEELNLDDDEYRIAKRIPIISVDNYKEVLK